MHRPNLTAILTPYTGVSDVYGKKQYLNPRKIRCSIIRLEQGTEKSSVRADSSGSRGYAREQMTEARLLVPYSEKIKEGDKLEVLGFKLTVQSVWPRITVRGVPDHWQVDCEISKD